MSLKKKLITAIASMCLLIAITSVSVWAIMKGQVDISGTVTFKAVDVYCDITGEINNVAGEVPVLKMISYSADREHPDVSSWQGNELYFDEYGTAITYKITIKNNSPESLIKVSLSDNAQATAGLTKIITFDGDPYFLNEEVQVLKNQTKVFIITFSIDNPDIDMESAPYSYTLTLIDEDYEGELN